MSRLRITLDDVIDTLRQQKIFDISEVKNAVVEPNGKISVQKKDDEGAFTYPIICDGISVEEYFKREALSRDSIEKAIKKSGYKKEELMLLTVDENGNIFAIKKDVE